MTGTLTVEHDPHNDVFGVRPHWNIQTEDDCKAWMAQFVDAFSAQRRKVDVVLILDDFSIGPTMGPTWGEYRARMVNQVMRFSVRVNASLRVSTYSATSAARHASVSDEAPDVPSAIALIKRRRQDLAS